MVVAFRLVLSFSPDGNQVAFAWEGDKQDRVDIYIKQIGLEKPLQITQDFGYNFLPAWSPDGRYIAFIHGDRNESPAIYLVPALGGPPRKLRDLQRAQDCKPDLSWSPRRQISGFHREDLTRHPVQCLRSGGRGPAGAATNLTSCAFHG